MDRWTKGCILPFSKKGDLGLAQNYRGITLTSIVAKIYNAQIRNRIEPKIEKIFGRTKRAFGERDPQRHKFWRSVKFLKVYVQKPRGNNIIYRLRQGLWLHSQRKDGPNTTLLIFKRKTILRLLCNKYIYIYIYMEAYPKKNRRSNNDVI